MARVVKSTPLLLTLDMQRFLKPPTLANEGYVGAQLSNPLPPTAAWMPLNQQLLLNLKSHIYIMIVIMSPLPSHSQI